jgi:hypothetical protein
MANYQSITALVDQIPADTWEVLREIKQRRPAIMLSELIDCSKRAPKQPERSGNASGPPMRRRCRPLHSHGSGRAAGGRGAMA